MKNLFLVAILGISSVLLFNCSKESEVIEPKISSEVIDLKAVVSTDDRPLSGESSILIPETESIRSSAKKIPDNLRFIEIELPDKLKYKNRKRGLTLSSYDIVEEWVIVKDQYGSHSGKIRLTIPFGEEETLMKFEVTENLIAESVMTEDFMMAYVSSNARSSSCIADCHTAFFKDGKKQSGYGGCKFGCWLETAAKVLTAAAPVLVVIILM